MADSKISALPAASTPLGGTEVLPLVQGGVTEKVSVANLTAGRTVSALQYQAAINSATVWTPDTSATNIQINNSAVAANSTSLYIATVNDDASTQGGVKFGAVAVASGTSGGYSADFVIANRKVGTYYENFRVKYNGDINFTVGNLVQGTAAKGVNFTANTPAAGMTSQLLNWYEEGTWTPTLIGGTTNPTLTYGLQRARYTRVGRLVTVSCYLSWSALSGGSGQLRLDGLPFAVSSAVPNTSDAGALMNMNGITLASGRTFAAMQAVGGTTYCVIRNLGSLVNGTTTDIPSTGASGEIGFTISYVAA